MQLNNFHSNGKLLLTGEYFVLDGALALALPASLGQSMEVKSLNDAPFALFWRSFIEGEQLWFEGFFELPSGNFLSGNDPEKGEMLEKIFQAMETLKPGFWEDQSALSIETNLEFAPDWGLGSSSTLITNLANWAAIDPFELLNKSFGGSGYDIACASSTRPILYQLKNGQPEFKVANFAPIFSQNLYFVHLGKKQNSREGIARYYKKVKSDKTIIKEVSDLTLKFQRAESLKEFDMLIDAHEKIIADALQLERAKDLYFKDFWGKIKSLGAWGGDFILATSDESPEKTKQYFNEKGFELVLGYGELVLGEGSELV